MSGGGAMIPKFRAWHKELKIIARVHSIRLSDPHLYDINYGDNKFIIAAQKDIELMQWTGWNDDFDVPIFLGDIVESCEREIFSYGIITYCDTEKNIECRWIGSEDAYFNKCCMYELFNPGFNEDSNVKTKIMGNIYENQDMIKIILEREDDDEYHPNPELKKTEEEIIMLKEEVNQLLKRKQSLEIK